MADVSDCDMEKGMVRCDVNVSVRPEGQKELGAKIEIKNMNSFSGVRKALEYEIPRQIEVVKSGGKLIQSTRRWDDVAASPKRCAPRNTRTITATFPSRTSCRSSRPNPGWRKSRGRVWSNCRWRASSASCAITNCPPPTRRPSSGTCRWAITSKALPSRRRIPKPLANWVINNLRAKLTETQTTLADLKFQPEAILELIELGGQRQDQQPDRAGCVRRDVRHRRIARQNRREERPGPGQRHRRASKNSATRPSPPTQVPPPISRPAKPPH